MIASVIEVGELTCEPNDLVISYQMNGRGKIHPTFTKNDRHVSLYMLDIGIDGSRPRLRIHVNARPPIEQQIHLMTTIILLEMKDWVIMQRRAWLVDAEDSERECCEEMQGEEELRSQSNHSAVKFIR
ncbi:hypothetical protein R3W88_009908 [Solanum pinnatisectum]|uniref:Uncharacterized protein n=1 Tax=Solanum pinnatisectum TaxID=50273 RepID=A0AAV9ME95_9SOLN|nr:hypothetical protein R3W88_009908 [Solanum pinnatisectum]